MPKTNLRRRHCFL